MAEGENKLPEGIELPANEDKSFRDVVEKGFKPNPSPRNMVSAFIRVNRTGESLLRLLRRMGKRETKKPLEEKVPK